MINKVFLCTKSSYDSNTGHYITHVPDIEFAINDLIIAVNVLIDENEKLNCKINELEKENENYKNNYKHPAIQKIVKAATGKST